MNSSTCQNFVHPVHEPSLLLGLGVQTLPTTWIRQRKPRKEGSREVLNLLHSKEIVIYEQERGNTFAGVAMGTLILPSGISSTLQIAS
jgi:hypothetical protein